MKQKGKLKTMFTGGGLVKKFILWIIVIVILVGIITTLFVQINLTRTLKEEFHERGQSISRNLASSSVEPLLLEDTVTLHRLVENIKRTEKDVKYVYITDAKGNVAAHTFDGGFPGDLLFSGHDGGNRLLDTGDGYVIDFSSPIMDSRAGFVHIGMDETYLDEKISQTRRVIIAFILIVGTVGISMAYIAGTHLTRPIRALVKGAEEIGRGNLGYQIEAGPNDETYILSEAFNQMSLNLKNSIHELRASEERYRKLVDGIYDAVILIDSETRILSWNRAAQDLFGWSFEEIAEQKIDILYSSSENNPYDIRNILMGEQIFIKKDDSTFPGAFRNKPLQEGGESGNVIVIRDITGQKEMENLEKQLLQFDKLATIGQLAAGAAHEINNPIANISLYTQILLKKKLDKSIKVKLTIIHEEALRAAHIVKGLLEFARQSEPDLNPLDINSEIAKVLSIMNHQFKDIHVKTSFGDIPRVLADSGQIRQVLMDMITNSIQSMLEKGEIIIKTSLSHGYVEISISDNGWGIPQENLGKIFDPFFTTKGPGEGTGLGLSICYGIIQRHNGSIEVESEVGIGTKFTIKLPG